MGVRGLRTEIAMVRRQLVTTATRVKLAKTLRKRLNAQVKHSIRKFGPRDVASCVLQTRSAVLL